MNQPHTNADGLWQKDVQEILRMCIKHVGSAPIDAARRQRYVEEVDRILNDPTSTDRSKIEALKLASALDTNNRQLLETLDKIHRLDNGQATERTESFTVVITEARDEPRADDSPNTVPQAD